MEAVRVTALFPCQGLDSTETTRLLAATRLILAVLALHLTNEVVVKKTAKCLWHNAAESQQASIAKAQTCSTKLVALQKYAEE